MKNPDLLHFIFLLIYEIILFYPKNDTYQEQEFP